MTQKVKDVIRTMVFEIILLWVKFLLLFPLGYVTFMIVGVAGLGAEPWNWIIGLIVGTLYSALAIFLLFWLPFLLYVKPHCSKTCKRIVMSILGVYCIAAMVCWDVLARSERFRAWDREWSAARIASTVCAPLNLPTLYVALAILDRNHTK